MHVGRQLHKRRLMPPPRPFILDPLPDAPSPSLNVDLHNAPYDLNGRRVLPDAGEKGASINETSNSYRGNMGGQRAGDNTQVSSSKSVHSNNETMSRIMTDAEDAEEQVECN